jgi:hypothetical protein
VLLARRGFLVACSGLVAVVCDWLRLWSAREPERSHNAE